MSHERHRAIGSRRWPHSLRRRLMPSELRVYAAKLVWDVSLLLPYNSDHDVEKHRHESIASEENNDAGIHEVFPFVIFVRIPVCPLALLYVQGLSPAEVSSRIVRSRSGERYSKSIAYKRSSRLVGHVPLKVPKAMQVGSYTIHLASWSALHFDVLNHVCWRARSFGACFRICSTIHRGLPAD
jgi:hypothetical protein